MIYLSPYYKKYATNNVIILLSFTALFLIVMYSLGYLNVEKQNKLLLDTLRKESLALSTKKPDTFIKDFNQDYLWETYKTEKYNFEIKFPRNYFVNEAPAGENEVVVISNRANFDKSEKALVIKIKLTEENNYIKRLKQSANGGSPVSILNQRLQFAEFKAKLDSEVIGTFLGDPPWGNYLIFIGHPDFKNKYLEIDIRTHEWEESAYGGSYQDSTVAAKILSTFSFLKQVKPNKSDWKIYVNKVIGFSFSYPPDWTVMEKYWAQRNSSNKFDLLRVGIRESAHPEDSSGEIRVVDDLSVDNLVKEYSDVYMSDTTEVLSVIEINYLGYPAKEITWQNKTHRIPLSRIVFNKDKYTFSIPGKTGSQDREFTLSNILSTFKFDVN